MDLKEEAAAEARAGWKESWAAVKDDCLRDAVEFLAETYMRHPEDLEKTVFAVEAGYGSFDPLERELPNNFYETVLGDQLEGRLCDRWFLAAANRLLAAPGTDSLQAWAEQERNKRGLESSGDAIAADGGFELGLDHLTSEAAYDLIVQLGQLTVADVITAVKGPEVLSRLQSRQKKREASERDRQEEAAQRAERRRSNPEYQRMSRNRQFYRENRVTLMLAAGIAEDRIWSYSPINSGDIASIGEAVRTLGWTGADWKMFAEGAPRGSIGNKVRIAMKREDFGAVPDSSTT